ncbi:hypothetical protein [Roseovarius sp. 217]|uniref:hypothetical protein n=1 Tax=Roseovarius sp. (strain 217) TaxID=314264 RepID=UPI000320EAA4|nr:hypothetical protein [Roseovarius sp. 217]
MFTAAFGSQFLLLDIATVMPFNFSRRKLLRCLAGLGLMPGAALSQIKGLPGVDPVLAKDGRVLVRLSELLRFGPGGRLLARVSLPETSAPVLGAAGRDAGHRLLWQLDFEGRAAGNHGDLYENRDRGHSRLPAEAHPQLTHVAYDDEARKLGFDYGLAGPVTFAVPLIGNSSTALKHGPLWRSLPRMALTHDNGPLFLYQNYLAGQMHVYPEHRDHDPDHGDLIPANTPYFLISQGSSGSDQPHLEALAMIFAAFQPETKAFLHQNQLLAPTVQMVFRRSLTSVRSRAAYLTGLAHPSVIPKDQINLMRMVQLANALTPETVPPMVRLAVLSEDDAVEGVNYFGEGLSERLFDTPTAIARLWRSHAYRRSMVVSVEATRDSNGRALDFVWRVLRGNPARTRIEPLDTRGLRARITVDWQLPRPVPGRPDILSNRVDVGVFARIGAQDSAPGLISILLPQHETRRYDLGPDGDMRIESLDRRVPQGGYADPVLFPQADWRDEYRYDAAGALQGWDRAASGETMRFDAVGQKITEAGAMSIRHMIERPSDAAPHIVMRTGPGDAGE